MAAVYALHNGSAKVWASSTTTKGRGMTQDIQQELLYAVDDGIARARAQGTPEESHAVNVQEM